jgi:hypothetical protein
VFGHFHGNIPLPTLTLITHPAPPTPAPPLCGDQMTKEISGVYSLRVCQPPSGLGQLGMASGCCCFFLNFRLLLDLQKSYTGGTGSSCLLLTCFPPLLTPHITHCTLIRTKNRMLVHHYSLNTRGFI